MQTIEKLHRQLDSIHSWERNHIFELKIVVLELTNYLMDAYIIRNPNPHSGIRNVVSQLQEIYISLKSKDLDDSTFDVYKRKIISCIESANEQIKEKI